VTTYNYTVGIEPDDPGFHAYVPAFPGCHTFGDTIDEARVHIMDAIELHIQGMLEDGDSIPIEREPLFITRFTVPVDL
jgi:predicted RNase H-like HicB family nuclease